MNVIRLSLVTGFLAVWTGTCMAAPQGGVVRFYGSIVEPGCTTAAASGSIMELKGCPQASRGNQLAVQPVRSVKAVGAPNAHVRLMADTPNGRYYDQRYVLVDAFDKPIQTGSYLITLTSP